MGAGPESETGPACDPGSDVGPKVVEDGEPGGESDAEANTGALDCDGALPGEAEGADNAAEDTCEGAFLSIAA